MGILAIDIGGTTIKTALVHCPAELSQRQEVPTLAHLGAQAMMEHIMDHISRYSGYQAIGISTAMQVDPTNGTITHATDTFPGYTGTPVKKLLEHRFEVPVAVENDVNCVAVAEGAYGAAKGLKDYLCVAYGTGVGGALVLDGKLRHGRSFSAGEVGHMRLHAGGLRCSCGGQGCYEAYAATSALVRQVQAATGEVLSGREICRRWQEGDGVMAQVMAAWIQEVVWGLASLIHIFDPGCVVLGGGILANRQVFSSIAAALPGELMESFRKVPLTAALLGNDAGMIGAAVLAQGLLLPTGPNDLL